MKKIIIILILLTGFFPSIQEGQLHFINLSSTKAQVGCPSPSCGNFNDGTGGGFISWFNGVLQNIGGFFSGFFSGGSGGGGSFGDEDGDYEDDGGGGGWIDFGPIDDDTGGDPPGGPTGVNPSQQYDCAGVLNGTAYEDSCGNCVGGTTGQLPCDCNGDQGGTAYYNQCNVCVGGNTGQVDTCDSSVIKYYITIGNEPKRYFKDDKIMLAKDTNKVQLIVHLQNGVLDPTNCRWTENDSLLTNNTDIYDIDVSRKRVSTLKVDSANVKPYINNPLIIYDKPIVYFKIGDKYKGEYGFDDSSHKHFNLRAAYPNGTEVKQIDADTAYFVPWMSLLDGQVAVTIKVDIKDKKAIKNAFKRDPNYSIKFVSDYNTVINLNGNSSIGPITDETQLKNMKTINISANQLDNRNDDSLKTVRNIYAITNTGDTIGKLKLSCNKPTKKKMLIVSVNTGSGYKIFDKTKFIDSINNYGMNQMARKWELFTPSANDILTYGDSTFIKLDTMNLTNEFNANPLIFKKSDTLIKGQYIDSFFRQHKGINMISDLNRNMAGGINTNDSNKVHVIFMMNYSIKATDDGTVGITTPGGYKSILWGDVTYKDNIHELGHILWLNHSFNNMPRGLGIIPKGNTTNYMDYPEGRSPDPADRFYFSQWMIIY